MFETFPLRLFLCGVFFALANGRELVRFFDGKSLIYKWRTLRTARRLPKSNHHGCTFRDNPLTAIILMQRNVFSFIALLRFNLFAFTFFKVKVYNRNYLKKRKTVSFLKMVNLDVY